MLEGINRRVDETEEWNYELEGIEVEII